MLTPFQEAIATGEHEQRVGTAHAGKTTAGLVSCSRCNETSFGFVPAQSRAKILGSVSIQTHLVVQTHLDRLWKSVRKSRKQSQCGQGKQMGRHEAAHGVSCRDHHIVNIRDDKRQEAEARDKRQEARGKRQETRISPGVAKTSFVRPL